MQETPVALPGPRMPADHGLTGLGFIMMLGGMLYALLMGMMLAMFVLTAAMGGGRVGNEEWLLLLFCAASVARSAFHVRAGRALLYGWPGGALGPTRTYVILALVHTAVGALLLRSAMDGRDAWIPITAMLAAWPVAVGVFALRTPLARSTDTQLPHPVDGGFESLSVLMTVFGLMGACLLAAVIIGFVQTGALDEGMGLVFLGVLGLLLVRSVMHVNAGVTGLRGERNRFVDRSQAYTRIGIASSIAVGGWFLLAMLIEGARGPGSALLIMLLYVFVMVWLLMAWPRMVKSFLDERHGYAGVEHRAADRGMTALGWVMLAGGAIGLAGQLSGLLTSAGSQGAAMSNMTNMFMAFGMNAAQSETQRWVAIGATALQLWAGIELVTMSPRFRTAAVLYGVIGIVTTVVINLEAFEMMDRLGASAFAFGGRQGAVMLFVAIIMSLVLPATALVLALRREQSQARVVRRD